MSQEIDPAAVFWDIGGVIVDLESIQSGHRSFVESLLEEYQSPLPPAAALETWRTALGEYFRGGEGNEYRTAREGYQVAVDEILSPSAEETDWERLFQQIHDEHAEPNDGAVETIRRLFDGEFHLGVISDVDDEEGERLLETFGVREYFDSYTSSEVVGYKKPDRRMFERALEKAGVEAEQAVMIGDRYANDMEGADAVGMTTISYGAEDGPAVDYHVSDLREIPALVGMSEE
jgi:putative hydrolase of the HAD superfamily